MPNYANKDPKFHVDKNNYMCCCCVFDQHMYVNQHNIMQHYAINATSCIEVVRFADLNLNVNA